MTVDLDLKACSDLAAMARSAAGSNLPGGSGLYGDSLRAIADQLEAACVKLVKAKDEHTSDGIAWMETEHSLIMEDRSRAGGIGEAMKDKIGVPGGVPELSDCVTQTGNLTRVGVGALGTLIESLQMFMGGHNDNTGMPCRLDLSGHDCCGVCNDVQGALRGYLEEQ